MKSRISLALITSLIASTATGIVGSSTAYAAAPAISYMTPPTGTTAGGTLITIVGTDFPASPAPIVTVGGIECATSTYVSSTAVTCRTPARSAGYAAVAVSFGGTPADVTTSADDLKFLYVTGLMNRALVSSATPPVTSQNLAISEGESASPQPLIETTNISENNLVAIWLGPLNFANVENNGQNFSAGYWSSIFANPIEWESLGGCSPFVVQAKYYNKHYLEPYAPSITDTSDLALSLTLNGDPTASFQLSPSACLPQTITFDPIADVVLSQTPITLNATTSAIAIPGSEFDNVTYFSNTPLICSVDQIGEVSQVFLLSLGTCSIIAFQLGTLNQYPDDWDWGPYFAATPVTRSFRNLAVAPPTLASIAITTPANKLIYTVGDTLNIAGLVVTGTYSDATLQGQEISAANVTGFNSSAPNAAQTLTVTVGAFSATYRVEIKAAALTIDNSALAAAAAAANAAANAAAAEAQKQRELTEILSVIPAIAGLALDLGQLTNSLFAPKKSSTPKMLSPQKINIKSSVYLKATKMKNRDVNVFVSENSVEPVKTPTQISPVYVKQVNKKTLKVKTGKALFLVAPPAKKVLYTIKFPSGASANLVNTKASGQMPTVLQGVRFTKKGTYQLSVKTEKDVFQLTAIVI